VTKLWHAKGETFFETWCRKLNVDASFPVM